MPSRHSQVLLCMVTHHSYPTLTDSRTVAFSGFIILTCQNPLHRLQIVCTAGPMRLARQKTESLKDENDEPYTAEFEAPSCQSWRAELVSATYFVHRRGYHDTKYYKTFCSCTKTNIFVEILHF